MAIYRGIINILLPPTLYKQMKERNKTFNDYNLLDKIDEDDRIYYSISYYDNKKVSNEKIRIINSIQAKGIMLPILLSSYKNKQIVEINVKKINLPEIDKNNKQKYYYETLSVMNVTKQIENLKKIKERKKYAKN
ncbi:hypothetical protein [Mycobacterium sp.]|uniref:hypothetical protein n=1 Tax=Mycobacterium sp. TaxID=1785 RepID=UPI003A87A1A4